MGPSKQRCRQSQTEAVVLLEMDYSFGIKLSYKQYYDDVQEMLTTKVVWVLFCTIEHPCFFMRARSINGKAHSQCMHGSTQETLSPVL